MNGEAILICDHILYANKQSSTFFSFFSKILFYLMVGIKSLFFFLNSYSKAIAHGVMA